MYFVALREKETNYHIKLFKKLLEKYRGVSKANVLRFAIEALAEKHNIKVDG